MNCNYPYRLSHVLLNRSLESACPSVMQHGLEPYSVDSDQRLVGGGSLPSWFPGSCAGLQGLSESGDSLLLNGVPDLDGSSKSGPLLVPEMPWVMRTR